MAAINLTVAADAAVWRNQPYGAGAGPHLPVGYWGGAQYRAVLRFAVPVGWQSWSKITAANFKFFTSDFAHVGPRNSSIYIRRGIWTKTPGTQNCDSGFTAANATQDSDIAFTTAGQVSFASGTAANSQKSVSVLSMVQTAWNNNEPYVTLVLDPVSSADYTELWASEKSGYDAYINIQYETASVPNAPLNLSPAAGAVVDPTTVPFSWTHSDPQNDPFVSSDWELYQNDGTTLVNSVQTGSIQTSLNYGPLVRGTTYKWRVRTSDATGAGAWSPLTAFTVRANPVVTISATRVMAFANGGPRLVVNWTTDQVQKTFQVTAPGYDSGPQSGTGQTWTLAGLALTDNTPVAVTVTVTSQATPSDLTGAATRSFTPRFGLTTHRRDLTVAPISWVDATVTATVPAGASLQVEYGSAVGPGTPAAPDDGWFSSIGAVPRRRWLLWRAWLIPSATAGPTLDKIVITANNAAQVLDKWGTTRDVATLAAPFSVAPDEAVYGTRSLRADITAGGESRVYSFGIKIKKDRTYILTGLMKSTGNTGAHFRLEDAAGNTLLGGGMLLPTGSPVRSDILTQPPPGIDWFTPSKRDTNRYKTPTYKSDSDQIVYVVCAVNGVAGTTAWFDALKLEESSVATPWSPGAIGATVIDAGGVQIDGQRGGVFRYKGSTVPGTGREIVGGGPNGLLFAGDTELASPATGVLAVNGVPIVASGTIPVVRVYAANATWTKPAGLVYITVECIGGGGAGGGTPATAAAQAAIGGHGGGGAYASKLLAAGALPATCAVVVGTGAAATAAGANTGGSGGASTFSGSGITTVSAGGGSGGVAGASLGSISSRNGGAGGAASGGDLNLPGAEGDMAWLLSGGVPVEGGTGGRSGAGWGSPGRNSGLFGSPSGTAASGYGAGGGGSAQGPSGAAGAGGAGSDGVVIVTEFYAP